MKECSVLQFSTAPFESLWCTRWLNPGISFCTSDFSTRWQGTQVISFSKHCTASVFTADIKTCDTCYGIMGNSICLCHMIIYESYESKCKRDNRAETSCRRLRTSLGSFFFRKRRPVWQITCVFINKFSHLRPQVNHCRQIENGLWQSSN